jgi:hypothetical protein
MRNRTEPKPGSKKIIEENEWNSKIWPEKNLRPVARTEEKDHPNPMQAVRNS